MNTEKKELLATQVYLPTQSLAALLLAYMGVSRNTFSYEIRKESAERFLGLGLKKMRFSTLTSVVSC